MRATTYINRQVKHLAKELKAMGVTGEELEEVHFLEFHDLAAPLEQELNRKFLALLDRPKELKGCTNDELREYILDTIQEKLEEAM